MELVEVSNNEVFCDSSIVAKKFGLKHKDVVSTILKLVEDLDGLRGGSIPPKVMKEDRIYRGNSYIAYVMDRRFFSLLSMRFRGKKALDWQLKFNDAFYEMESKILNSQLNSKDKEWLGVRSSGKIARIEETDIIKEFVDYATQQGSKSAKFYYKHITTATYQALDLMSQKNPKLRESMNIYEVSQLLLAEKYAGNRLLEYMTLGRNYKDIYQSVKQDLILFANAIRIA